MSFSGDDLSVVALTPEPPGRDALGDLDLSMLDAPPAAVAASVPHGGFDLDELLANGPSQAAVEYRPASRATASAVATPPVEEVRRIVASAPAQPEVVRLEIPAASFAVSKMPVVSAPARTQTPPPPPDRMVARAPVTTELPLFMQVMSEAVSDRSTESLRAEMPLLRADATTGIGDLAMAPLDVAAAAESAQARVDVDDKPLVEVPVVLRQPLAVRRTTPDPARLRAKYARAASKSDASVAGDLLQGLRGNEELDVALAPTSVNPSLRMSAEPTPQSLPAGWLQGVSAGKRVMAAAVDTVLLGVLNAAIVWFTLGVCGIAPSQALLLPLIPIGLFILLMDGGYLVLFTAACGQTIGKMAAGIRVVGMSTGAVINDRISMGQAVARAIGTMASCVPLGMGFWFGLVGDRRAFHDRIAHTRVVRA